MSQTVHLIMSISRNGVIGQNGQIPWELPDEQKRFRTLTLGHVVVMGRKTWENLRFRPLPGRECVILTRNENYEAVDARIFHSFQEILEAYPDSQIWVAGGASVFDMAQRFANKLHLTVVDGVFEGDAKFKLKGDPIDSETVRLQDYEDPESGTMLPVLAVTATLR